MISIYVQIVFIKLFFLLDQFYFLSLEYLCSGVHIIGLATILMKNINGEFIQKKEVFFYNYFYWTFSFFLGLQWSHADEGILQRFVLNWEYMKLWPSILWIVFFSMIFFLISLFCIVFHYYVKFNLHKIYFYWGMFVFFLMFFMTINSVETHIHHYTVSMVMITFIGYQHKLLTITHAIFCGIMIEGASKYGYDPIWTFEEKI